MRIAYTPEQERFRSEVREYFEAFVTPEVREAFDRYEDEAGSGYREAVQKLGADGWLTVSWPREYGGRGLSQVESYIFFEETQRIGIALPWLTLNTIGPTLMRHGSDAQRAEYLPRIASGEIQFSVGYSEPASGTDLASLQTRAVRDGEHWVINGQKMWTSLIHHADYVWLAARTDPDARKHAGISMFIVPTDTPGFTWTPVHTLRGGFTSAGYYQDVRIPAENLVGPLNEGWRLMTSQLNAERVTISPVGPAGRKLEAVTQWAAQVEAPGGGRLLDEPWVQANLGRVRAKLDVLQLMNWQVAAGTDAHGVGAAEASGVKVYGTEFYVEAFRLLMEVMDADALLDAGTPGAELRESLESAMRWAVLMTFGGGTNEVQREIVARAGLGLPRPPR